MRPLSGTGQLKDHPRRWGCVSSKLTLGFAPHQQCGFGDETVAKDCAAQCGRMYLGPRGPTPRVRVRHTVLATYDTEQRMRPRLVAATI